ncbi:hypothetical protein MMC07_002450 [Pseudocyphellaria aurata]|nr:hypothetical protein [Pseudocyphellaria aurata]
MHIKFFPIVFLSVATAAILPQHNTEPDQASLLDLLRPTSFESDPPSDSSPTWEKIKFSTVLDPDGQGDILSFGFVGSAAKDLTFPNFFGKSQGPDFAQFNLIKPGSVSSTPAFSDATFNLIATDPNPNLLDGAGTPDLTVFTGTENSSGKSLDILASKSYALDHICDSAKRVRVRQQCLDLHNILIQDYQMESNSQGKAQNNQEFEKLLRDDSDFLNLLRKESSAYLQQNVGAQYQCRNKDNRVIPLCCLGPPPTNVNRGLLQPRQPNPANEQRCVVFLLGRPWCNSPPAGLFCCRSRGELMQPVFSGFWGLSCVPMLD